jgi:hypothetical protein
MQRPIFNQLMSKRIQPDFYRIFSSHKNMCYRPLLCSLINEKKKAIRMPDSLHSCTAFEPVLDTDRFETLLRKLYNF